MTFNEWLAKTGAHPDRLETIAMNDAWDAALAYGQRPEAGARDAALDEIETLIGAVEGRHFSAIATAESEDDKRRHGTKVAFAMELRAAIRALKSSAVSPQKE